MGIADYLLLAALAAYTVFTVVWLIRRRRQGKTCCGASCTGNCASCAPRCKRTGEK